MQDKLLMTGLVGSLVTAVCCFTPLLVWLFAFGGFSQYLGRLDNLLVPALLTFLSILGWALWRRRER
ncbi:mercury resistance system transport protein MerF [Rhodovibrionaceae bacterium A322]